MGVAIDKRGQNGIFCANISKNTLKSAKKKSSKSNLKGNETKKLPKLISCKKRGAKNKNQATPLLIVWTFKKNESHLPTPKWHSHGV